MAPEPVPPARSAWLFAPALLAAALLLLPAAAGAEVLDAGESGFTVRHALEVDAAPEAVWVALVEIGAWWSSSHTFSGDAANLSLDPRPQGCFCERLADGGGVTHLTVVYAEPPWTLRLQGGLGPLQQKAAFGSLTVAISKDVESRQEEPAVEGQAIPTRVELTYQAGGYLPDGFAEWAPPVDRVLGEQLRRLALYVETGSPEPAPEPATSPGPG